MFFMGHTHTFVVPTIHSTVILYDRCITPSYISTGDRELLVGVDKVKHLFWEQIEVLLATVFY